MPDHADAFTIDVDGEAVRVEAGTSVAVALLNAGHTCFRRSVAGEARAPLCGMGICFDCVLTIDGRRHQRSCQVVVAPGMKVETCE